MDHYELLVDLRQSAPPGRPRRRPARSPARLPRRLDHLHSLLACLCARRRRCHAVRGPRRSGPGRRHALPRCTLDHHGRVHARRRARQGAGRLGRGRGCRRGRRRAAWRRPDRARRLATDLPHQPPRRPRARGLRPQHRARRHAPPPVARPRSPRRASRHAEPRRARLRRLTGRHSRLGLDSDPRARCRRTRGARRFCLPRAPHEAALAARASARRSRRRRRVADDARRPAVLFGTFLLSSLHMQNVLGTGALESGLAFLPMAAALAIVFTSERM